MPPRVDVGHICARSTTLSSGYGHCWMELNVVVVPKNFIAMDNYKDTFNVQNTAVAVCSAEASLSLQFLALAPLPTTLFNVRMIVYKLLVLYLPVVVDTWLMSMA